jgi:uncharacterized coiled-coil protein SlyX
MEPWPWAVHDQPLSKTYPC